MMITRETPFKDYMLRVRKKNACAEAQDWSEDVNKNTDQCTFGHFVDSLSRDNSNHQSWATWAIRTLGDEFDEELRRSFLQKIKDPMVAFQIYLRLSDLTDDEDKMLESLFKNKLPTAERELQDGIVIREKGVNNG